jgi:SNF2 family DNA or RNA helicase
MELSTDEEFLIIVAEGLEFLRLKASIISRLGELPRFTKNTIRLPLNTVQLVSDLLQEKLQTCPEITDKLNLFHTHELARETALRIVENGETTLDDKSWEAVLDPAQATAVRAMIVEGILGLCLFDEQGSGKTVMTIAAFDILKQRGDIDAMIVLCPKSMLSEWPKDISRFLESKYQVVVADGSSKDKYNLSVKKFDVLISNYEGLTPMLVNLMGAAKNTKYLLVVDESFYLKNGDSVRSDSARKLRGVSKTCFVLCGTPAPNSAYDLINQFDLADQGFTFAGFKKTNNLLEDSERIEQIVINRGLFIRRLKPQILDHVPDKNFHILRVPLTGKQALMYERARKELELELRTFNNETFRKKLITYFQRRAALLQICTCPQVIDPILTEIPVKYLVLDKLIEELIGKGRKIVVWSFFRQSIDALMSRYAKYNPVRVDGSVPSSLRQDAVRSFQEDPKTMLFVGNPAAAGAGITLHSAYDAIYVSYSNQAAHYLQSLDRIHRRGQKSDEVNYYLVACEGTIEETEIIRLRGKEVRQHQLLGDQIQWPCSLDEALAELQPYE